MPPREAPTGSQSSHHPKKRKEHPSSSTSSHNHHLRGRDPKRVKIQDARSILAQTSDAALSNGELDLQKFLAAREFEIKALDDGMRRAKGSLTTRAFQQVPRDMRRRTASHNVKRVPKRLQSRAKREMREDNTPAVTAKKRKPASSRGRVRAETARRLGVLAERKKKVKEGARTIAAKEEKRKVVGRAPRVKLSMLSGLPVVKSKFRKRQMHKTWLPTHIYHAKRAKMTEPKQPLWRFAVPLTSTEKSYRPTHRSGGTRGAVCWDMSYMATIGLEGTDLALEKVLRAVGITQDEVWAARGRKWKNGQRTWNGCLSRSVEGGRVQIGPATVIWSASAPSVPNGTHEEVPADHENIADIAPEDATQEDVRRKSVRKPLSRRLILRIHPSAFLELWAEILQISKLQRPVVHVEDLRFEVGSIEITGPNSTETLLGILHPFNELEKEEVACHANTFRGLGGVTNPGSLPPNALLTFSIMDPRLRYPPRRVELPTAEDENAAFALMEMLGEWPADKSEISKSFFDRSARHKATQLPSQKALNRRKGLALPENFPARLPVDPPIPLLLYTTRTTSASAAQGTWTLLAPWKCILPIWYGLMHYPLSSGGNPRFGGLQEIRQINFEQGQPWFPGDFPGTQSGWAWELNERDRRKAEWDRRPKGKRTEFTSLNLGAGEKGEVGVGWACDFEKLLNDQPVSSGIKNTPKENIQPRPGQPLPPQENKASLNLSPFQHLPSSQFSALLNNPRLQVPPRSLAIVRITLFSRGVPLSCARIYRLPTSPSPSQSSPAPRTQAASTATTVLSHALREHWLALVPPTNPRKSAAQSKPNRGPTLKGPAATLLGRRALAQDLLQTPPLQYPATSSDSSNLHPPVPGEADLIGFVTTGNFNLAEGKGTAIGSLVVEKVLDDLLRGDGNRRLRGGESRICIVRNAGETVGRLGVWEAV